MKRLTSKSKSGFTLLEVLLATVIMVIASTMIMQGFIAVMVLGANNRKFAESGDYNYRMAMNQTLIGHATNPNQIDSIDSLTDGKSSKITATLAPGVTGSCSTSGLNMVVDVSVYSDPGAAYTYTVAGDGIDTGTVANNRFAFFYDFGDYMHCGDDHIMRWGYTINPADNYAHITVQDETYNTPVYDDRGRLVAYGRYGWYCFNADHDAPGSTCSYRSAPYNPAAPTPTPSASS
jgi:prepilin-type N-terminal cleavage/methylation domain-containing protein